MAPGLPWKMFLVPGLLLGLKLAKVDFQSPNNLIIVRVLYGLSQVFLFGLCAFIARGIQTRGDGKKTLQIGVPPSPSSPGEESKETKVTFQEYDMGELKKLIKNFAMGAAVTLGIHIYMQVVQALPLQIVTQPITLIEHPLFQIYVLNKDPASDSKLKRPFADNSPFARLEAMKKETQKQKELQEQRDQSSTPSLTEGADTLRETSSDAATGGDAQTSISTADRRSTRPSTAE